MDTNKNINRENLTERVANLILELGGSFVGFSNVFETLPEQLEEYPNAVSFGVRLSDAIIDEIGDKPTFTYFNHYRSVNALIDQIGLRIMLFIQENGYKAYTIAASQSIPNAPEPYSGVFPHKTGAVASGQGWIGKNGLFIHKNYGPRVRLGTVLTNMKLEGTVLHYIKGTVPHYDSSEKIIDMKSICFSCNKCVEACPAMALTGKEWHKGIKREEIFDARACSEYMNKNFKHIGRGSVCGICIKVCPYSAL